MKQEIEIEFKNLLKQDEFEKLKSYFHITNEQFAFQENHYFDTINFQLKSKGAALRIRSKQDQFVLTLKQPNKVGLLETHQSLSTQQAKLLLAGTEMITGQIKEQIKSMGINEKELEYFGSLRTNRSEVLYKNGKIVLDHSFYLNVEDYEVEYEVDNEAEGKAHFKELLEQINIPIRETQNKIQRFYIRKKHLLNGESDNENRLQGHDGATSN